MIGDNRFSVVNNNLAAMFELHAIDTNISRLIITPDIQEDIFGTPDTTPTPLTTKILVTDNKLDETPTLFGGKPKETLKFISYVGTVKENDEVTYEGHIFKIKHVNSVPLATIDRFEACEGLREVSV